MCLTFETLQSRNLWINAKLIAKTTTKTPRELYTDTLNGLEEEIVGNVPNQAAFAKVVRKQRTNNHPTAPKNVEELVLPEIETSSNEKFVMYDSGPGKTRIIMFATQRGMAFLSTCDTLHMDGTFSSSPVLFEQMYTIHGSRNGWNIPICFVVCCDKKAATYRTIFNQLKVDQPKLSPSQINVDFELAAIKAAHEVFPKANIQGCYFHLTQSIIRNLGAKGLKQRYETDVKFASEVRQMMAIAYVPVDQVILTWETFIKESITLNPTEQSKDSNINSFVNDYFNDHYIGKINKKGKRGKPPFPLELWNVHEGTKNGNLFFKSQCL